METRFPGEKKAGVLRVLGACVHTTHVRLLARRSFNAVALVTVGFLAAAGLAACTLGTAPSGIAAVMAGSSTNGATVTWAQYPASTFNGATTSYQVTAYQDGVAQTPVTISGSPPPKTYQFAPSSPCHSFAFVVTPMNAYGAGGSGTSNLVRLPQCNWAQASPPASPSARAWFTMAYDPMTAHVLLFGGNVIGGDLSDTWENAGAAWVQDSPALSPPARDSACMAFDVPSQRMVLFGGNGNGTHLNDTWLWDGSTWSQASPATSPSVRVGCMMATDSTGHAVLFGGQDDSGGQHTNAETWRWDGSTWQQLAPSNSPPSRSFGAVTYDIFRQRVVLFGGVNVVPGSPTATTSYLQDTWEWDGTSWSQQSPANIPPAGQQGDMAYSPPRVATLLFGGVGCVPNPASNPSTAASRGCDITAGDTAVFYGNDWQWDGNNWTDITSRTGANPPSSAAGATVHRPTDGDIVLFGGANAQGYLGQTWTLPDS